MSLRFIIISLFAPINVSIWSLIILPQHCLWCFNGGSDPYVQHQENEKKISHAWGHLTLSACVWSTCVSSRLYYGRYLIGCLFSLPQTQVAQVWGLWVFGLSPAVFSLNAFSGVDGRISHSPTRHMFRLNIHIYTQSAVVSTSWSHMGNMSLSIMYMCFVFFVFFLHSSCIGYCWCQVKYRCREGSRSSFLCFILSISSLVPSFTLHAAHINEV